MNSFLVINWIPSVAVLLMRLLNYSKVKKISHSTENNAAYCVNIRGSIDRGCYGFGVDFHKAYLKMNCLTANDISPENITL